MSGGDGPNVEPAVSAGAELAGRVARLHEKLDALALRLEDLRAEAEANVSSLRVEMDAVRGAISALEPPETAKAQPETAKARPEPPESADAELDGDKSSADVAAPSLDLEPVVAPAAVNSQRPPSDESVNEPSRSIDGPSFEAILEQEFADYFESTATATLSPEQAADESVRRQDEPNKSTDEWA